MVSLSANTIITDDEKTELAYISFSMPPFHIILPLRSTHLSQ
jgi:hypothetical protein